VLHFDGHGRGLEPVGHRGPGLAMIPEVSILDRSWPCISQY
jgi:hypothetical protein